MADILPRYGYESWLMYSLWIPNPSEVVFRSAVADTMVCPVVLLLSPPFTPYVIMARPP